MEWRDVPRRGYYEKYERVPVKNDCGWFEVYRLPGNVYAIAEPQHFQEVNFFLIIGTERAVLLDTGMGIFSPLPLLRELYDGEIKVVNSHFHFDHIGCNHCFDAVSCCADDFVRQVAETGLTRRDVGIQVDEELFKYGYPAGFDPERYQVPPYRIDPVKDGDLIPLGGRTLQVLNTPGHSDDCLMLYDEAAGILFTGDTFYLGALYAHFDCPQFGRSDLEKYRATLERLVAMLPDSVMLYCSHNDFMVPIGKLREAADLMARLGDDLEAGAPNAGHQYLEDGNVLRETPGDGFSIVYAER